MSRRAKTARNQAPKPPEEFTPEERAAVGTGRAELERGDSVPLEELVAIVRALRKTPNNKHPKTS